MPFSVNPESDSLLVCVVDFGLFTDGEPVLLALDSSGARSSVRDFSVFVRYLMCILL